MPPSTTAPAWTSTATPLMAFLRGLMIAATTPGIVLFSTALGYGALARDSGLTLGHTVFLSAFVYALPAQVVLVDQLARGATAIAAAFAVTLTAVRLLPMTVALLPYLRDGKGPAWIKILAVHFIAVTAWVEGNRRLPTIPPPLRLGFFVGIGLGMAFMTVSGSAVGYLLASKVPTLLSAVLLFMTPVYFLLSLLMGMRTAPDTVAIVAGAAFGPLMYLISPGFDLLLTGLAGGTLAFLLHQRTKQP